MADMTARASEYVPGLELALTQLQALREYHDRNRRNPETYGEDAEASICAVAALDDAITKIQSSLAQALSEGCQVERPRPIRWTRPTSTGEPREDER